MNTARLLRVAAIADGDDDDIVADPSGTAPVEYVEPNKARVLGVGRLLFEFWFEWLDATNSLVIDSTKTLTLRPVLAVLQTGVPQALQEIAGLGDVRYLDAGEPQTVAAWNPIVTDEFLNKDRLYILLSGMASPPAGATQIAIYGRELEL